MAKRAAVLSALGLIGAEAALPEITLRTGTWTKPTGATATVAGTITFQQTDATEANHAVHIALTGMPTTCPVSSGANTKCKIIVQKATACKSDGTSVGADPAAGAYEIAKGKATSQTETKEVANGGTKLATLKSGHVVEVFNDADTSVIACAKIEAFVGGTKKAKETTLAKLANKETNGKAQLTWKDAEQVLQIDVAKGDKTGCAKAASEAATGCHIMVSKAKDCKAKADDLKKEYASALKVKYYADSNEKVVMNTKVLAATKDEMGKIFGQVLIVTDKDGAAVACGAIEDKDAKAAAGAAGLVAGPLTALFAALAAFFNA